MPKQTRQSSNIRKVTIWISLCICAFGAVFAVLKIFPIDRTAEKEISAELVLAGLPDGLTVTPPPVKFVGARVKGPADLINSLTGSRISCKVSLAGMKPGLTSIPLTAANFGLSATFSVTAIDPGLISLEINTADQKTLPVYIAVAGKPAAGFMVIDTLAVPGNVTVTGPENLLAGMDRVMTKPISIDGIAESIRKETALDLPADVNITAMDKAVVADIRIEAETNRRIFSGIRVIARGTGHTAVFTPPEIVLEIEGPTNVLTKLDRTADITAYVDLEGLGPGVYVRRAAISLPLGTTLVKAKPVLFTVSLAK